MTSDGRSCRRATTTQRPLTHTDTMMEQWCWKRGTEQFNFQGAPFSPTFVVEFDDLPYCKIKNSFFPSSGCEQDNLRFQENVRRCHSPMSSPVVQDERPTSSYNGR